MERSIAKALEEYEKIAKRRGNGTGIIYASDIYQAHEIASKKEKSGGALPYWHIITAMQAGYAIGYRAAKRHRRKE